MEIQRGFTRESSCLRLAFSGRVGKLGLLESLYLLVVEIYAAADIVS